MRDRKSGPAHKMNELVERMLKLHKDLPKPRTAPDETAITERTQHAVYSIQPPIPTEPRKTTKPVRNDERGMTVPEKDAPDRGG